ncbi:MAG: methyltransferase domain-containing protein [Candidatus Sungbacteria bacterium]|uniref:Methyltransferase domain-containing protein n=1 Tax=Candidatus Sungiibacteriota bacterium TaxID=2750080 RepID=A0A933DRG6_9BACT|nr:methyltransferase domain-containing protein [Candidatus Sungbacteria bacterium]
MEAKLPFGRFYDAYGASMDAALEAKINDIEPWLKGGLVVDRGCGTGALARYLATKGHKIVGVDLSDSLWKDEPGAIHADIMDPVFADGFVNHVILSSVMHEVYSYHGCSRAAAVVCLANSARELKSGGSIIIRDIWSPEEDGTTLELEFDLETYQRFCNFESRWPESKGPVTVMHQTATRRGTLPVRVAVEFLAKKDYTQHWDLELREVYTALPISFYREVAGVLGLTVREAKPIRNDWIIENRWSKGVRGELPPYTNQLIVFEK